MIPPPLGVLMVRLELLPASDVDGDPSKSVTLSLRFEWCEALLLECELGEWIMGDRRCLLKLPFEAWSLAASDV